MSKVMHFEVEDYIDCKTPCPYREGVLMGSRRCARCVFLNKMDADDNMLICDWDNYSEH